MEKLHSSIISEVHNGKKQYSNTENFSFPYKNIKKQNTVYTVILNYNIFIVFTDLFLKNLTLLHFCCMLTHWQEKQILMLSELEYVPEKLLSSSSPSAQFAHTEPPWISAESQTHYLDWYQHSVSVPQE